MCVCVNSSGRVELVIKQLEQQESEFLAKLKQ